MKLLSIPLIPDLDLEFIIAFDECQLVKADFIKRRGNLNKGPMHSNSQGVDLGIFGGMISEKKLSHLSEHFGNQSRGLQKVTHRLSDIFRGGESRGIGDGREFASAHTYNSRFLT
ncbi:10214_t:CDS:2 [Acaulospora morrowiae]|uniref:10214_t:CDS:1 n=1 Tax=Acaulospora morrowiae TaxID=94023 RepID=A0A9N9B7A1_9GLOM|nr:10214_t:CDS:2 [Acaulospora morrowiae]